MSDNAVGCRVECRFQATCWLCADENGEPWRGTLYGHGERQRASREAWQHRRSVKHGQKIRLRRVMLRLDREGKGVRTGV